MLAMRSLLRLALPLHFRAALLDRQSLTTKALFRTIENLAPAVTLPGVSPKG